MNQTKVAIAVTAAFFAASESLADTAAKVKRTWRNRDDAKLALIPCFAKKMGLKNAVARDDDGNVVGWINQKTNKKVKSASDKLSYLLNLAYVGKKSKDESNNRFDAEAYASRFCSTHTKAQTKRLIDALRAEIK